MLVFCWVISDESIMLSKIGNCSPSIDRISVNEICAYPTFKEIMIVNRRAKKSKIMIIFHREARLKKLFSTSVVVIMITKNMVEN